MTALSRHSLLPTAAGLGLLLGCLTPAAPVSAQAVERVVYASVLDAQGKPTTAVTPSDLVVRDDGVAREVLRVAPATEPMQVALLVDNSQASTSHITNLREALSEFVKTLAAAGHSVSIVTLADRPTLVVDTTSDATRLADATGRLFAQPNAGMLLLDAVVEVTRGFKKRETPRPVIVAVITEGIEFSNLSANVVLDALTEAGAAFHAVVLTMARADTMSTEAKERNRVLDEGTREHGGRRENLLTSMALKEAMAALADELLHQVAVTFARPASLIPPRRTTVDSARSGLTVRGVLAADARGR